MRTTFGLQAMWGGVPLLIPVNQSWEDGTEVRARADHEEDNEEEGLEVEDCGLDFTLVRMLGVCGGGSCERRLLVGRCLGECG